ncbi:MAG: phosphoglycerate kinase, partial [Planctomycetaceae bacterium]
MSISIAQTTAWCTKLVEKTPDFPLLEACLDLIPSLPTLNDLPPGTRVLIRGDTDVVVAEDGAIGEDVRLRSLSETLKFCLGRDWVPIVYGHMGRDPQLSLKPVAEFLKKMLADEKCAPAGFCFIDDWMDNSTGEILSTAGNTVKQLPPRSLVVLENTRKYSLEQSLWKTKPADIPQLAETLTRYANGMRDKFAAVHINEGFAASNRDLSSTLVPLSMDRVALGAYIDRELREHTTRTRQSELVIFSGMKINKLDDLEQILERGQVRTVIAAGSLAMSLKKADAQMKGEEFCMGLAADPKQKIFIPPERIDQSLRMLKHGQTNNVRFVLPVDFILGNGQASSTIPVDEAQFDVGPETIALHQQVIGEFID